MTKMTANGTAVRQGKETSLALAAISHDLRTSVTSVIALAQLALDEQRQGKGVEERLEQILAAARAIETIIGDLTAGCAPGVRQGRFSAEGLSRALRAVAGPQAKAKGQSLLIDMKALGKGMLLGDRAGIERVLLNLLTNAVKYTGEGGKIRLTACVQPGAKKDRLTAIFTVEDNGMGMKPEFISRIYQPYTRAPEASTISGTGLGLAITRRLVERMGGSIDVHSRWGEGTCFTVRLPFRRETAHIQKAPAPADNALAGQRILLAEDNALCAQIGKILLERAGAQVSSAENGQAAVERFAASAPGTYSTVLLDMNMPVLSGCGAAKAIRAMDRHDAERIPVFALTASSEQEVAQEAERAGMNGCLRKPINVGELAQSLRRMA